MTRLERMKQLDGLRKTIPEDTAGAVEKLELIDALRLMCVTGAPASPGLHVASILALFR